MTTSTMTGLRNAVTTPFEILWAVVALGPAAAALAAVDVAMYALLVANAPPEGLTATYLSSWGGNNPALVMDGQIWRLLTYSFLHGNLLHLLMNVLPILAIGAMLSAEFGWRRFLALHLLGVVGGGLTLIALDGHDMVTVGSSGDVFALGGAFVALAIRRHPRVSRRTLAVDLPLMAATSLIPGVDWRTHVGGFVLGLILTLVWTRGDWKPVVKW